MNNVNADIVFDGSLLSLTDVFCNTEGAGLGSASVFQHWQVVYMGGVDCLMAWASCMNNSLAFSSFCQSQTLVLLKKAAMHHNHGLGPLS